MVVLLPLEHRDAQLQEDYPVGEVRALQEELVERRELELQALQTLHLSFRFCVVSFVFVSFRFRVVSFCVVSFIFVVSFLCRFVFVSFCVRSFVTFCVVTRKRRKKRRGHEDTRGRGRQIENSKY